MKKILLSMAFIGAFGLYNATSFASEKGAFVVTEWIDGGHKCDDQCKLDKAGNCTEVKKERKKRKKSKVEACSKESKSCSSKCAGSKEKANSDTDPKS